METENNKSKKSNLNISPNSTNTFKNMILKYHKYNSTKKKLNNKKDFLRTIQKKIYQLDIEEEEREYMFKEVKRQANINREILYNFGPKFINHYDEAQNVKFPVKIEKSKFFNPLKDYKSNKKKKILKRKYNSEKLIYFPKISKSKRNVKQSNSKSLFGTLSLIKRNVSSIEKKDENNKLLFEKNFETIPNKDGIESYCNKKKYNNSNLKNINLFNKKYSTSSVFSSSDNNSPLNTYSIFQNKKNNSLGKNKLLINEKYFNYLQNIRAKFLIENKRQEQYFTNNQYGCDKFKLKYNYVKKKYFE